jgi:hypothetical protein
MKTGDLVVNKVMRPCGPQPAFERWAGYPKAIVLQRMPSPALTWQKWQVLRTNGAIEFWYDDECEVIGEAG